MTLRATHTADAMVSVTYTDASGERTTETVATPWELTVVRSGTFEERVRVENDAGVGSVGCEITAPGSTPLSGTGGGSATCTAEIGPESFEGSAFGAPLATDDESSDAPGDEFGDGFVALPFSGDFFWRRGPNHILIESDDEGGRYALLDRSTGAVVDPGVELDVFDGTGIRISPQPTDPDGNVWVIRCRAGPDVAVITPEGELEPVDADIACPDNVWVVEGAVIVHSGDDDELVVFDPATRAETLRVPDPVEGRFGIIEVDGRVFVRDNRDPRLFEIDLSSGATGAAVTAQGLIVEAHRLADGKTLVNYQEVGFAVLDGLDEVHRFDGGPGRSATTTAGDRIILQSSEVFTLYDGITLEPLGSVPRDDRLLVAMTDDAMFVRTEVADTVGLERVDLVEFS